MSAELPPALLVDAASLEVPLVPVPAARVVSGEPREGFVALDEQYSRSFGIQVMTPGSVSAVEQDEFVVVLSGRARIEFVHVPWSAGETPAIEVGPGSILRLTEGMRTVWTVHETIRTISYA